MFESAKLKLQRAEAHAQDYKRQFEAFVASKPHRFGVKHDPKTGQPIIQIRTVESIPESFSVVIADAIHNLRTALDHITWEIVGWDGGNQHRGLQFPCAETGAKYETLCEQISTPSQWIKDMFKRFEASYDGRGRAFYVLHQLDIADKHRTLNTILGATTHPPFTIYREDGEMVIQMVGNIFTGFRDTFAISSIPAGCHVELHEDANCTPSIFLSDVRDIDALEALEWMGGSVVHALQHVEAEVASHGTTG